MLGFDPPRPPGSVGVGALMKGARYNAEVWSNGDRLFQNAQVDVVDTDVPGNSLVFYHLSSGTVPQCPSTPELAGLSSFTMTFETAQILNLSWSEDLSPKTIEDELRDAGAINPVSGRLEEDVYIVTDMLVADNVRVTGTCTGIRPAIRFEPCMKSQFWLNLGYVYLCMFSGQPIFVKVSMILLLNMVYMACVTKPGAAPYEHTTPTSVIWGEVIIGWKLAKLEFYGNKVILNRYWSDTERRTQY